MSWPHGHVEAHCRVDGAAHQEPARRVELKIDALAHRLFARIERLPWRIDVHVMGDPVVVHHAHRGALVDRQLIRAEAPVALAHGHDVSRQYPWRGNRQDLEKPPQEPPGRDPPRSVGWLGYRVPMRSDNGSYFQAISGNAIPIIATPETINPPPNRCMRSLCSWQRSAATAAPVPQISESTPGTASRNIGASNDLLTIIIREYW